jgi:hypothetical protein
MKNKILFITTIINISIYKTCYSIFFPPKKLNIDGLETKIWINYVATSQEEENKKKTCAETENSDEELKSQLEKYQNFNLLIIDKNIKKKPFKEILRMVAAIEKTVDLSKKNLNPTDLNEAESLPIAEKNLPQIINDIKKKINNDEFIKKVENSALFKNKEIHKEIIKYSIESNHLLYFILLLNQNYNYKSSNQKISPENFIEGHQILSSIFDAKELNVIIKSFFGICIHHLNKARQLRPYYKNKNKNSYNEIMQLINEQNELIDDLLLMYQLAE